MSDSAKACPKCKGVFPRDTIHFYRHAASSSGLMPRCKSCVNEDNKACTAKRMASDPISERAKNADRTKRHYHKNIEAIRELHRARSALDRANPEKRSKIYMRKRGGGAKLTVEQFNAMLREQGGKCAICRTAEPDGHVGHKGWQLDHCHVSGRVRFILCGNCNRGLGAFKDNFDYMRRAADLLEKNSESSYRSDVAETAHPVEDRSNRIQPPFRAVGAKPTAPEHAA